MVLSGTTRVSRYPKKHSATHNYHGHESFLICFFHLIWSIAPSLFNPHSWQSFHNLSPSFPWSISWPGTLHFILHTFLHQSLSSFCNTCPYHCNTSKQSNLNNKYIFQQQETCLFTGRVLCPRVQSSLLAALHCRKHCNSCHHAPKYNPILALCSELQNSLEAFWINRAVMCAESGQIQNMYSNQ